MLCAVRYMQNDFSRCDFLWVVFAKGEPFKASSFFFSSRRLHTRCSRDWSSDVCSSDLAVQTAQELRAPPDLDAVGVPEAVQLEVGGTHVAGDPGAGACRARCGAAIDDGGEVPIHRVTEAAVAQRSEERRVGEEGRIRWVPDP